MLTPEKVRKLSGVFIAHLRSRFPTITKVKQFIIAVGGFPGSGKTTAAIKLAELSKSVPIQSNSARQLLRDCGLPYGENVHSLIREVLNEVMPKGYSIVMDGMIMEVKERIMLEELAKQFRHKIFYVAITGNPKVTETRARERYADGKPSTFFDWRASNRERYMESIHARVTRFQEAKTQIPDFKEVNNDGTKEELLRQLDLM